MGEIADMMLDGTMCQGCGVFLHDGEDGPGYPGYCSGCAPKSEGRKKKNRALKCTAIPNQPIAAKLVKTLKRLVIYGTDDGPLTPKRGESMYAGHIWEGAPAQYAKLEKRGFVERRSPHNPAHKDRAVITAQGLAFLETIDSTKSGGK